MALVRHEVEVPDIGWRLVSIRDLMQTLPAPTQ